MHGDLDQDRDCVPSALASMATTPTELVRAEWSARIAAEYTSAAITQHLVLWLMQLGAPPDLLSAGLLIVADELEHSRLSHETFVAAGGVGGPAIDRAQLSLGEEASERAVLRVGVQSFCLGETVAVPLFSHLRDGCTVPVARVALDRILRDEVRHRDFGWDLLDWLGTTQLGPQIPGLLADWLPSMFASLDLSYGSGVNPDASVTDNERAWGLAPPRDYAVILQRTVERDYQPRFSARGIDAATAWAARTSA